MEKVESLEAFYRQKLGFWPSENVHSIGHFNVFGMEDYSGPKPPYPMPYSRKDFFKIALIYGPNTVDYVDQTFHVQHNMLMFANPLVPYRWTPADEKPRGVFCLFTDTFFKGHGSLKEYPLYQPGGTPILDLTNEEAVTVRAIFDKMFEEIRSDFSFKYDVLRTLTLELIFTALKLRPALSEVVKTGQSNASERIATLFLELLERQFPIESPLQQIHLKFPGEFAEQLHVHSNHLNKALKEITGKTTSQLISERIATEARALLKHTNWNIAEISWCLGFEDPSNFIKFFKKNTTTTPKHFRD
ncbi:helix-turn-helix transcriptional regulator [Cytophagaceae bacterium DM2B3-1]|uniref:Helix-turn-helix transcriptional regulator n=1 Tax=Xanthocytophaga flava TaxID=3048013 RepID=A0ABT7CTV5_9BACT|nr:helix-turn-helix transcriptional regulator [Xanthocytophaga flavus]MDJ1497205.1 helix-turn-helix transcriptional regulator [Xanthocytophaga flavus]